ncbi:hypothetical protein Leryth_018291 [Lithospermum erythrorhizon]|nr:hypothetical protein Leryth_018291 [Lithospermum erythrorhizon]
MSSSSTSIFLIKWINFLTMLLAVGVIGFGLWVSSHHDGCRKSLTLPVIGLGAIIFVISVIGFFGARKNKPVLLWIYLIMLFFILVAILIFTVLAFIVTNNGSGHHVNGLRFKEYQLEDYSSWFLKQLNNSHNWERLKSCLVKSNDCNNLPRKFKTLKKYKLAKLTPIEAGCCRPPSEAYTCKKSFSCKLRSVTSVAYYCLYASYLPFKQPFALCAQMYILPSLLRGVKTWKEKLEINAVKLKYITTCLNWCGYPAVNASYYDLSYHSMSAHKDCKRYKNSRAVKCYYCDSCKAGLLI